MKTPLLVRLVSPIFAMKEPLSHFLPLLQATLLLTGAPAGALEDKDFSLMAWDYADDAKTMKAM